MVAEQQMEIAEAGEEVIVDDDGDMQGEHMDGDDDVYEGMDEDDQAIMM